LNNQEISVDKPPVFAGVSNAGKYYLKSAENQLNF